MPQPFLHDLVTTLRGVSMSLSGRDGQLRNAGVQGSFVADRRIMAEAVVELDGIEPVPIQAALDGDRARFSAVLPRGTDDLLLLTRTRHCVSDGTTEVLDFSTHASEPFDTTVSLRLSTDLADLADVRAARPTSTVTAETTATGMRWRAAGAVVDVECDPPPDELVDRTMTWRLRIAASRPARITVSTRLSTDPGPAGVGAAISRPFEVPHVDSADPRLAALVERSVVDLSGLALSDPLDRSDTFLGAGAPWYLTLFGRDSIWAARMLLPLGTRLAGGTLRALARRQGREHDPNTAEAPGKILHELRRFAQDHGAQTRSGVRLQLPPLYYGTVDATPLWISLLHDAWRWGLAEAEVAALLPALDAALGWLSDHVTDARGFLSYADETGHGLANQGWKDSGDAVQFADGRRADAPIALCEAQAYAHAAARQAADLLDAFGRPGGEGWRDWADALADRFRARFWVTDDDGPYPAIALDAHGRPVDTLTSNIGHLLGTGLLDDAESDLVARRLRGPELDSGFGLRTMSARALGFDPLSYHCGSVWPHDTAIAIGGLSSVTGANAARAATSLIRGLVAAAPGFDYRVPELYSGDAGGDAGPLPYPTSCRPQAWSAAASIAILTAVLGLRPDVPGGVLRIAPLRPSPFGALTVRGLQVGGQQLDVAVDAGGTATVLSATGALRVVAQ